MLGELIYESKGKITGQRVLSVENAVPKLKLSVKEAIGMWWTNLIYWNKQANYFLNLYKEIKDTIVVNN